MYSFFLQTPNFSRHPCFISHVSFSPRRHKGCRGGWPSFLHNLPQWRLVSGSVLSVSVAVLEVDGTVWEYLVSLPRWVKSTYLVSGKPQSCIYDLTEEWIPINNHSTDSVQPPRRTRRRSCSSRGTHLETSLNLCTLTEDLYLIIRAKLRRYKLQMHEDLIKSRSQGSCTDRHWFCWTIILLVSHTGGFPSSSSVKAGGIRRDLIRLPNVKDGHYFKQSSMCQR